MKRAPYLAALAVMLASCAPNPRVRTNLQEPEEKPAAATQHLATRPAPPRSPFSRITYDPVTQDILYFIKQGELQGIKSSQDPRIDSRLHQLERELARMPEPTSLNKEDFEYYMTKEAMKNLENSGDSRISTGHYQVRARWNKIQGYTPSISQDAWKAHYTQATKIIEQETGDQGILR